MRKYNYDFMKDKSYNIDKDLRVEPKYILTTKTIIGDSTYCSRLVSWRKKYKPISNHESLSWFKINMWGEPKFSHLI